MFTWQKVRHLLHLVFEGIVFWWFSSGITVPKSYFCTFEGQWIYRRSRGRLTMVKSERLLSSSETWCSCLRTQSCTTMPTTMCTKWRRTCTKTLWDISRYFNVTTNSAFRSQGISLLVLNLIQNFVCYVPWAHTQMYHTMDLMKLQWKIRERLYECRNNCINNNIIIIFSFLIINQTWQNAEWYNQYALWSGSVI